jgi:hypothetical protein
MEETLNPSQTAQILVARSMLALENQFKSGINQFYWIAGLSLVNTGIYLTGGSMTFVIGLGITQVIDAITKSIANEIGSGAGTIITLVGLFLDLIVAGLFILFGVLGRKRFGKVIISGIVLYAMDGLIFLLAGDWPGLFFHVFMLFGLGKGYRALNKLKKLEEGQSSGDLAVIQPLIADVKSVSITPEQKKAWKSLGILLLFLTAIYIFLFFFGNSISEFFLNLV